ncbi:hypothetical protein CEXT_756541 [Caerostris extrusa]|uniref:Ycf15 n=1 Tax=Caerostris extrusa TaxID=172846 RepID=A0AAV4UGQ6_CAEEX|nr:hypothetical protein CEXT_756541 [Caerostris extrusa]
MSVRVLSAYWQGGGCFIARQLVPINERTTPASVLNNGSGRQSQRPNMAPYCVLVALSNTRFISRGLMG